MHLMRRHNGESHAESAGSATLEQAERQHQVSGWRRDKRERFHLKWERWKHFMKDTGCHSPAPKAGGRTGPNIAAQEVTSNQGKTWIQRSFGRSVRKASFFPPGLSGHFGSEMKTDNICWRWRLRNIKKAQT